MRTFLIALFAAFFSVALTLPDAEAKRFGGGRSIGKQRDTYSQQATPRAPAGSPAVAPQRPGNRWLGPLAGLAAGGLLGAMLFGGGFSGINFFDILIVLALVAAGVYLFRRMRRGQAGGGLQRAGYAGAYGGNAPRPGPAPVGGDSYGQQSGAQPQAAWGGAAPARPVSYPPGFDADAFVREAKASFMRMQTAYDAGNLEEIRDFTAPQVYQEVRRQIEERHGAPQHTEVVTLNAEVVDVTQEGNNGVVSVRFSGLIKEDGLATPFAELWHVQKSLSDPRAAWVIAGIQQL